MARGIAWLDSLGLRRQNHVIAGVLGAYMAIAQYAPHKDIAAEYIQNLNNPEFKSFGKMKTHEIVEDTRNKLAELHMRGKTGAQPAQTVVVERLAVMQESAQLPYGSGQTVEAKVLAISCEEFLRFSSHDDFIITRIVGTALCAADARDATQIRG